MGNNHSAASTIPSSTTTTTTLPSASTHSQPPSLTAPATMEASQQRPRHSLDGNSSRDEAMDWNPERDDTQPSRRVRARLADALLSLSSSPPSNNISSTSTQQSTMSSTSPLAALSQQQQQQAQSSVPSSGAMSSVEASTSTARTSHSGNNISSRPPIANNPRIGPYGRIIRPLPHRTSARQGTRSSQSQQTRRQYTAHRIPRPPIVLNSSSSSSSSDDGSSQGIPEPAPRRAAADRLPHLQHHMTGQQQQNLSGEEAALLQEYATLSALVSEIIGGVPPPIPRVVGGYPEAPSSSSSSSIPFPSAASSSSSTLRGSASGATSSTSSAETSRPSRAGGSRRPDGQREIRAGTSIIVQGALYTRTARRGESSDTSSPASASASAGASSRSAQASSSSSTVPRSRRTSSPSSTRTPQQTSTPSPQARAQRPAGPTPTERAHMLNRLLRVAAAATAATIVSRSEGLVPPPAAAPGPGGFGEFVGRNAFGSRAGASTVPGAGVGAQGQSRSSAGGSGSGVTAAAAALTNRARSSWDGSRSSSTTTPSGSSTGGAAAGLRSLLGGHRRSLQRSMQRSGNSLDLLADSRSSSSGTSSPSSTLASAGAGGETRSLSDVAGSGHSRLPGSWIDAGLDALQSRIGRSSTVRAGGTNGRPAGLRQRLTSLAPWMRASRAVVPPSSSASSSQARGGGPSIARASTDQESIRSGHEDDGEADEGEALTQMLRESLAHPMPSRVQRSRSFASLRTRGGSEGIPNASTGGGQAGLDSTGHPSTSAGGNTPSGSNANASAEPIPPHGVRVDIRDSAASISAFLDRARAGVESGSGEGQDGAPLQGSFEWFLNTLCTDLEAAMAEMDVEQERVARVEAAVRRGAREARAGVRAEEEAGEGGGGGVDAETSAAEESVAEILRRVFGSGTTSASADPNDPTSVPERRRGDVHNAELSFFRMFCFPRANQAGVSSDSLAPSPSNIHPPAGAASTGVGSEFVLHPDLIPCVVVGVRSMTAADERRYAGDEDDDEGDDDDDEEEVVEEQRPQTPQTPPSLPGAWGWARRFPWRSSSRASSARASSPSPATTPILRDPDGDVIMREARPDAQEVEDEDEASSVDTSGSEDIGTVDSEDDSEEEEEEEEDRDDQAGLPPRSWRFMLWVSGGFWPRSHPLLRAPAPAAGRDLMLLIEFLTAMASPSVPPPGDPNIHGRAPGFPPPAGGVPNGLGGALMELFGLMGNGHAPRPKATKTELEKSGETRVAKGWELGVALKKGKGKATSKAAAAGGKNLVEQGVVLESTAQRCLICLEEWEDDDEVRILSCRHAFHLDCVDRWLIQSSNTCPMCRKAGVTKDSEEGRVPAPPVASV